MALTSIKRSLCFSLAPIARMLGSSPPPGFCQGRPPAVDESSSDVRQPIAVGVQHAGAENNRCPGFAVVRSDGLIADGRPGGFACTAGTKRGASHRQGVVCGVGATNGQATGSSAETDRRR